MAKLCYLLRFVGDNDEALRCAGDDLLAQELAATSLNERKFGRDFVGAINRKVEAATFFKGDEGNSVASPQTFAVLRTRDCTHFQTSIAHSLAEQSDPKSRSRSRTES